MLPRSRSPRCFAMTSFESQAQPPARVGQYEILCELGRGGMAVLYLARVVGLGGFERLFALKMIHDDLGRDPEFVRMFLDEARLVARIRHPNVVPVYEVGMDQGRYFIAMDYVSGETLGAALAATWPRQRPFPVALAMHIIAMAGEGLHAAHELTDQRGQSLGVIHRDVAPGNIMLGYDGAVRVMDFGVAKAVDQASGASADALKGTLAYMAPELMRGTSRADRRADVFALGVLLWEMCVGKRLFKGRTDVETARRVMRLDVPVPSRSRPEIPAALDDVILRTLAREPGQRPPTARALSEQLQQVLAASGQLTTSGDVERFLLDHFADRLAKRREMERKAAQETVPDDLEGVVIEEEPPLPEQVDDADIEPLSDDEAGGAMSGPAPSLVGASTAAPPELSREAAELSRELADLDASLASVLDAAVATVTAAATETSGGPSFDAVRADDAGAAGVPVLEDGLVVVGTQRPSGATPPRPGLAPAAAARGGAPRAVPTPGAPPAVEGAMAALAALAARESAEPTTVGAPAAPRVPTPPAPSRAETPSSSARASTASSSRPRARPADDLPAGAAPPSTVALGEPRAAEALTPRAPSPAPVAAEARAPRVGEVLVPRASSPEPLAAEAPAPRAPGAVSPATAAESRGSSPRASAARGSIPSEVTAPMATLPLAPHMRGAIGSEATAPMASAPRAAPTIPMAARATPGAPIEAEPTAPLASRPAQAQPGPEAPHELAAVEASDTERALVVPVRTARLLEQRERTMVVRTRRTPREPVVLDEQARAREDQDVEVMVREAKGSRVPLIAAVAMGLVLAVGGLWWASAREPRVIVPTAQVAVPRSPPTSADVAGAPPEPTTRVAHAPASPSAPEEALPPPVAPPPRAEPVASPSVEPVPALPAPVAPPPPAVVARPSPRAAAAAVTSPRPSAGARMAPARASSPRPPGSAARARASPSPRRSSAPALISGSDL